MESLQDLLNDKNKQTQLTRGLKDDTMKYQGIRLPCKNDQGH